MAWVEKLFIIFVIVTAIPVFFISVFGIDASSDILDETPTMIKGYATAYCDHGVTASGEETRLGICAAKKEWIGKTIILYQRLPGNDVGDVIGIYEVKDCGGTEGLKNGQVVDIWFPELEQCKEFMNYIYEDGCKGKVYFQVLDAKG